MLILVIVYNILFSSLINAQQSQVVLERADSLISFSRDTIIAGGDVRISHNDIKLKAERLVYISKKDYLELEKDIYIYRLQGEQFWADRMFYFRRTKDFSAAGNVKGTMKNQYFLFCDSIYYNLNKRIGWIWYDPIIKVIKNKDSLFIYGDSIFINRGDEIFYTLGDARLSGNNFKVFSDSIVYISKNDSVVIKGSSPYILTKKDSIVGDIIYVKLNKNNTLKTVKIEGNVNIINKKDTTSHYTIDSDTLFISFYGENKIQQVNFWYNSYFKFINLKNNKIYESISDSMVAFFYSNGELDKVFQFKRSKMYVYTDVRYKDSFTGDTIVSFYKNNKIELLKIKGQAIAEYYDESNKNKMYNKVSSDSINIYFSIESKPIKIDILGRVEGNIIMEK